MKRFKLNFTLVAFLVGGALAITQSAFTPVKKQRGFDNTEYQFNGTMLSQDKTVSEYVQITPGDEPSCDEIATLPCVITVPSGTSLSSWLGARTNQQVVDDATDTRD